MQRSISLGRLAGIEVGINWTWLIIFALVAFSLAAGIFPEENPGLSDGAYVAMAVIASVLFFGSILLHELGHALQARRDQVEIEGITLWLFGGVARFKDLYRSPASEFRIAVAGPLVTLVIGGVLLGLGAAVELPTAIDGVVFWLGYINLVILAFNLLPALPLDGGRILHSALWGLKGDLLWATNVAAGIGVAFGYLLIGAGIMLFFFTPALGGIWLALIGWFLTAAANAEAQQMAARQALGGVAVSDLMSADPVTVEPRMTLARFMDDVASRTRFTSYPVVDGRRPVGLLRFQGVLHTPRSSWERRTVEDCMLPVERVPTMAPDREASEVLADLLADEPHRALVLDEAGRLLGILSIRDLARAIQIELGDGAGPTV
jgi:Zn-dependent protease/predicted transcriptional regulator